MPPPPSQKGKFKPRKPPKKSKATAAAAAATAAAAANPDAAPSSTAAFAPPPDNRISRDERGGGGRGGRGRGGRGRGGRVPIPSGKVFFTGGDKGGGASAGKKRSALVPDPSAKDKGKKGVDSTEEIVGQLETAVGANRNKDKESVLERSSLDAMDYELQEGAMGSGKGFANIEAIMYDSDSSEEESERRNQISETSIPPLSLPFPTAPLPVGVGGKERPENYFTPDSSTVIPVNEHLAAPQAAEILASPFVGADCEEDLKREKDSWFLVQLPTRLPPLKPKNAPASVQNNDNVMDEPKTKEVMPASEISEVVTPPVVANSHDDTLTTTAPGRLGKIVVYKSGKTLLVMEGPNNNEIRLNVSEGLTCGFLQQAVAIDGDSKKFVALGDIHKSIVVTPDLNTAFAKK